MLHSAIYVSILVLMEVTLKVEALELKEDATECFNPCFNGSDSKSFGVAASTTVELGFQSLF